MTTRFTIEQQPLPGRHLLHFCGDALIFELQVNPYNRATYTKPWFRVKNDKVGEWIEIPFEIKEKGRYSMSLFQHLREERGETDEDVEDADLAADDETTPATTDDETSPAGCPPHRAAHTLAFFPLRGDCSSGG